MELSGTRLTRTRTITTDTDDDETRFRPNDSSLALGGFRLTGKKSAGGYEVLVILVRTR